MRPLAEPAVRDLPSEAGDFEAFFRSEYPRLVRAVYLLSGARAEAEDVAQEAMARVYERWERVRAMDAPDGYLYRVALHLERRRRYRLGVQARKLRPTGREPADPAVVAEARSDVLRALLALPRADREVLVLAGWLGLDGSQAAAVLRVKPSTARARLSRARARFRTELGEGYA